MSKKPIFNIGFWQSAPFTSLFKCALLLHSIQLLLFVGLLFWDFFPVVILTSQTWVCFPVGFCFFACSWFSFICLVQISYCSLAQAGDHLAVSLPSPPGSWGDTQQYFLAWKPILVAGLLKTALGLRLFLCLWVSFTSELFPCFSAHKYCICWTLIWRLPLKHSLEAGPARNPMQMGKQARMECSGKT